MLGLPTTVLAVLQVRESRDPDPKPVDWPGVGTLSTGLFLVVFAVLRGNALGWTSPTVLGLVALGLAFLAAFAAVELRVAAPMLDLRLFRNRTFLGATVIVATLAGGSFGTFVYLSLFLLDVRRGTPVEVGLWLAPLAIVAFVVSLVAGRLSARVPLTAGLALGMALCAGGLVLMTGLDADSSWLHLLAGLIVVGAGTGLANPLVTFAHLGVLPPAQGGLASGINNTARQLGLAIGIAVLGALLQSQIADRVEQRTDGLGAARRAVTEPDRRRRRRGGHAARAGGRARQPARDLRGGLRLRPQRDPADRRGARARGPRRGARARAIARPLAACLRRRTATGCELRRRNAASVPVAAPRPTPTQPPLTFGRSYRKHSPSPRYVGTSPTSSPPRTRRSELNRSHSSPALAWRIHTVSPTRSAAAPGPRSGVWTSPAPSCRSSRSPAGRCGAGRRSAPAAPEAG